MALFNDAVDEAMTTASYMRVYLYCIVWCVLEFTERCIRGTSLLYLFAPYHVCYEETEKLSVHLV